MMDSVVAVQQLVKAYSDMGKLALDNLSFGIGREELFSLLRSLSPWGR
ncbi:MAG: hypothetical protein LLG44_05540 [Chloroflexi bacterium]|nr:hypothetical protein [Chloroflexota bacterium]